MLDMLAHLLQKHEVLSLWISLMLHIFKVFIANYGSKLGYQMGPHSSGRSLGRSAGPFLEENPRILNWNS